MRTLTLIPLFAGGCAALMCSVGETEDGNYAMSCPNGDETVIEGAGPSWLIRTDAQEADEVCPYGGVAIHSGPDDNDNGALDDEEIADTDWVCNGQNGLNTLVTISEIASGDVCLAGGSRVDAGLDEDRDGELDAEEITSVATLCNGLAGDVSTQTHTSTPFLPPSSAVYRPSYGSSTLSVDARLGRKGGYVSTLIESDVETLTSLYYSVDVLDLVQTWSCTESDLPVALNVFVNDVKVTAIEMGVSYRPRTAKGVAHFPQLTSEGGAWTVELALDKDVCVGVVGVKAGPQGSLVLNP